MENAQEEFLMRRTHTHIKAIESENFKFRGTFFINVFRHNTNLYIRHRTGHRQD